MSACNVVGLKPWLPWPLRVLPWWTGPVRAERLAALRIGIAVVLLSDVLGHYLPFAGDFLGRGSLGSPEVFVPDGPQRYFQWSLLRGVEAPASWRLVLWGWAGVAGCLLVGLASRWMAALAWALGISINNVNPFLINSGDNVRNLTLFFLMLSPCGAAWSVDSWLSRRRSTRPGPVCVQPWPLRLLFVQMTVLYFMTGVYKTLAPDWHDGSAMHYILANLGWTRFSYAQLPAPDLMAKVFARVTLLWELGFPLLVFLPWTRVVTLWLGVLFHLGTGLLLQLGPFPFYMICLYLPLVPWERWVDRQPAGAAEVAPSVPSVPVEETPSPQVV